ncbi:MAG: YkvA family protein, partial [Paenibacillaceae bacterium]
KLFPSRSPCRYNLVGNLGLYYAFESPNTPKKAKAIIIGALGYLIFPLDVVTDILPVIGFVDDLGVLGFALAQVAMSIDNTVKQKAKDKLKDLFGEEVIQNNEVIEVEKDIIE